MIELPAQAFQPLRNQVIAVGNKGEVAVSAVVQAEWDMDVDGTWQRLHGTCCICVLMNAVRPCPLPLEDRSGHPRTELFVTNPLLLAQSLLSAGDSDDLLENLSADGFDT